MGYSRKNASHNGPGVAGPLCSGGAAGRRAALWAVALAAGSACSSAGSTEALPGVGGGAASGAGASGGSAALEPAVSETCVSDADCPGGFCDRTGCLPVQPERSLGVACEPRGEDQLGRHLGRYHPGRCGLRVCLDGRCRSCFSDSACRTPELPGSESDATCERRPEFLQSPVYQCGEYADIPPEDAPPPAGRGLYQPEYENLGVQLQAVRAHDPSAQTEGLVYAGGWLYESTGLEGASSIRRVELETGRVVEQVDLPAEVWATGLARVGEQLFQLTRSAGRGFVWSLGRLALEREFSYEGAARGLCFNGQHLVMSDGSSTLQLRDPQSFERVGSVEVVKTGFASVPLAGLVALECVGDTVFANWERHRFIARIEGATGKVTGWVDTGGLLLRKEVEAVTGPGYLNRIMDDSVSVVPSLPVGIGYLNGIAHHAESGRLLLGGQRWPVLFEVEMP